MSQPKPQFDSIVGKWMVYAAWILLLGLLTIFFNQYLDRQQNPNAEVEQRMDTDGSYQVHLKRNRYGHYVSSGRINGQPVTFLLDTGASNISIPDRVARRLDLKRGTPHRVVTANGTIQVYSTTLDSVAIGALQMRNLRGGINPHMQGEEILLGMNFLKHLEIVQRGDVLILNMPTTGM